jgi:hypothetical protein
MDHHLLYLMPVVFLAYFFKGTTGFGSAIILVALGSVIADPIAAVTLVTLLDVAGGAALLRIDPTRDSRKLWTPLALSLIAGAVAGASLLRWISLESFKPVLGVALMLAGVWMVFLRGRGEFAGQDLPDTFRLRDLALCLTAGVCGGLTGLSGPPLVFSFGGWLSKEAFRRILTRIFLGEAIAKVVTYTAVGVLKADIVIVALLSIPVLFLGLYAGNHVFFKISEKWFGRAVGAAIVAMGLRLIF